jgi:hypothetical protein
VTRVSACSFIVETDDLWLRRIDRAFFDEAPRVERVDGQARLVCPGDPGLRVPLAGVPWANDPACSGDPFVRVPQLEKESISAEILFPTLSWALLSLPEPLRSASLVAYNSWVWNIGTTSPRRLFAAAMLPAGDPGAELQRVASLGIKAAIVPVQSVGCVLDELWGLAASLGMPLVMAQIGGATPFDDFTTFSNQTAELTERAARAAPAAKFVGVGEGGDGLPENVSHVVGSGDGATGRRFWGRFGIVSPAGDASDDGNAARYFNLPE